MASNEGVGFVNPSPPGHSRLGKCVSARLGLTGETSQKQRTQKGGLVGNIFPVTGNEAERPARPNNAGVNGAGKRESVWDKGKE